jgi:hypothetical protein
MRANNKTVCVFAMCVCNPDRSLSDAAGNVIETHEHAGDSKSSKLA